MKINSPKQQLYARQWHKTILLPIPLLLICLASGCAANLARLPTASFERSEPSASSQAVHGAQKQALLPFSQNAKPVTGTAIEHMLADASVGQIDDSTEITPIVDYISQSYKPATQLMDIDAVNAPVDGVLFSLATEAGFELVITGTLKDRVTLKLQQASLPEVMDQLSTQTPIAWRVESDVLKIWSGEAYAYSYPINYLNMHRRTQSSVGLATQVGTINASNTDSGSIANSSETRIENTSDHRFWESLNTDIQGLMNQQPSSIGKSASSSVKPQFSINPEAGLLTLYAFPVVHQTLQRYLSRLHDSTRRQVLIEATVVEVTLSDSFEAGVDWQVLAAGVNGFSAAQVLLGAPLVNADTVDRISAPAGLVSMVQKGSTADVRGTLNLLEQFGDVRILSRPRIIALNNQSSVLKVVDNRVYFTAKVERSQSENRDEIVTETEIHTVPVGLVMNVTPQISASGAIMLNVRPTLSRILGFVNDPNPELAQANVRNGVPEIQVREMESMLSVQSGDVAIIGGLMQETTEQNDSRLPGVGRLPLLKYLFSQRARNRRQTELMIVLRPTVIDSGLQQVERS